jgi:PPOX class probable F420-dependent enzyme
MVQGSDAVKVRSITGSTVVLTTYRRDGIGVSTPVSFAIRDGLVHFVTATNSGKAKRLLRNSRVSLATSAGAHTAMAPIEGHATPVPGAGWNAVLRLVRPTPSLIGSYLWYRLRGIDMALFRVVLDPPASPIAGP